MTGTTIVTENIVEVTSVGGTPTDTFNYVFNHVGADDVEIYVDSVLQTSGFTHTPTATGDGLGYTGGQFVLDTPISSATVVIRRKTPITRPADFSSGSGFFPMQALNQEQDWMTAAIMEIEEQANRSLKLQLADAYGSIDTLLPALTARRAIMVNAAADGFEMSTYDPDTLQAAAAASAAAALVSENNAAASEAAASASEIAAAASEAAAAAFAASAIWQDVQFKTFADSPITIATADKANLLAVDTSGGPVVINLPTIAGETMPFILGVKKTTDDGNGITINRGGTDTINGVTSLQILGGDSGATLVADTDTAPDEWTAMEYGPSAGDYAVDPFVDGVGFTAGTTTQLTLSRAPGSENNIDVQFDGVTQHHSQYSVAGTTLTFTAPIPLGVSEIEVKIGSSLSIGTPADGTVTAAKLDSGDITAIRNLLNVDDKRNYVINGDFAIAQRGNTQSTSGYKSIDRWQPAGVGTTFVATQTAFTIGQTDVPGEPLFYERMVVTSSAGVSNYSLIEQRIEDVRTLAGQQFTLTFYAKADASKNIAVEFEQNFGTGGSPSARATGVVVSKVAITSSWARYKVTGTLPSVSGKVVGTNNDHYVRFNFWFDAGSDFNGRTDTLGQQSGTFDIANVAIYKGDTDQDFVPRPRVVELALCQRYYQTTLVSAAAGRRYASGLALNSTTVAFPIILVNPMRDYPSMSYSALIDFECIFASAFAISALTFTGFGTSPEEHSNGYLTATVTGATAGWAAQLRAVNNSAEITYSAEL